MAKAEIILSIVSIVIGIILTIGVYYLQSEDSKKSDELISVIVKLLDRINDTNIDIKTLTRLNNDILVNSLKETQNFNNFSTSTLSKQDASVTALSKTSESTYSFERFSFLASLYKPDSLHGVFNGDAKILCSTVFNYYQYTTALVEKKLLYVTTELDILVPEAITYKTFNSNCSSPILKKQMSMNITTIGIKTNSRVYNNTTNIVVYIGLNIVEDLVFKFQSESYNEHVQGKSNDDECVFFNQSSNILTDNSVLQCSKFR